LRVRRLLTVVAQHTQVVVGDCLLGKPAVNVARRNFAGSGHPEVPQIARCCPWQAVQCVHGPTFITDDATAWKHSVAVLGPNLPQAFKQVHHVVGDHDAARNFPPLGPVERHGACVEFNLIPGQPAQRTPQETCKPGDHSRQPDMLILDCVDLGLPHFPRHRHIQLASLNAVFHLSIFEQGRDGQCKGAKAIYEPDDGSCNGSLTVSRVWMRNLRGVKVADNLQDR